MKRYSYKNSLLTLCMLLGACTQPAVQPAPVLTPTPFSPSPTANISSTPIPVTTVTPTPEVIVPTPSPSPTGLVKTNRILFDTSKNPFGINNQSEITSLSSLRDYLTSSNFTVLFDNFNNLNSLDNIDTILIFSPSLNYSSDEIAKLSNFVKSGKKVVIAGEWGGYGSFEVSGINEFLKQANLQINEDVIKEYNNQNYDLNDEQILVKNFTEHPVTEDLIYLSVYSSASVDIINGGINPIDNEKTKLVAYTANQSFKIKANVNPAIAAVSAIGEGKIVVIGDSSEFTNNDTNKNSKINLDESDNKKFILNILNW